MSRAAPPPFPPDAEPVVVTAFGVVSPLGLSVEELARRFAAGECARGSDEVGVQVTEIPVAAIPADKRAHLGRLDRFCRLFLSAAYLAWDAAALDPAAMDLSRVGLSFGTGLGCLLTDEEFNRKVLEQGPAAASPLLFAYTVSSAAAGEVAIALGAKGPNVTAHMGFAAGLGAIGYGFDLIQTGKADVVLAGGADAVDTALVQGLRDMDLWKPPSQSRPFQDAVPGLYPAEGAVVAVLERRESALRRGARPWGRIDGYAGGFEPSLSRGSRRSIGIVETMRRALALSGRGEDEIGLVMSSAHGTGIDRAEREALAEVFGGSRSPLVLAPKTALGESFAASGVLDLALAAGLMREAPSMVPGLGFAAEGSGLNVTEAEARLAAASVAMVNSLCYSGNVVSLLFSRES